MGALAVGVLAAIGAVFVAMSENRTTGAQPERGTRGAAQISEAAHTTPDQVMTAPLDTDPFLPLITAQDRDPLLIGLGRQVQLLTNELQNLRQQEEEIERRLKLINQVAALMEAMEGSSLNGGTDVSRGSDSARWRRSPAASTTRR